MPLWAIYVVTHKESGKQYVGQTCKTVETRWRQHCSQTNRPCPKLSNAINAYGPAAFSVEHVLTCSSKAHADASEVLLIEKLGTFREGYNLTIGGGGVVKTVCKWGHSKEPGVNCKECETSERVRTRQRERAAANRPKMSAIATAWTKANRALVNQRARARTKSDPDLIKRYKARYKEKLKSDPDRLARTKAATQLRNRNYARKARLKGQFQDFDPARVFDTFYNLGSQGAP